jgi:magnesium chelatase subunit I
MRELVEQVAFTARSDKRVDKRSGVSQRLPISTMELVVSNAERRALLHGESLALPRIGDLFTALPGITGKIELEYEGEMRGADVVVRELIRTALASVYDRYFAETNTQQIEQWFNLGGSLKVDDTESAQAIYNELAQIQGLFEKLTPLNIKPSDAPERVVAAAEFLLEGMVAHRKLSRSEERGFSAGERGRRNDRERTAASDEEMYEAFQTRRNKRGGSFN